jgi:hypothetical protein
VAALGQRFGDSLTIVCIAQDRDLAAVRKELRWHHFVAVQLVDPRGIDEPDDDGFQIDALGHGVLLDPEGRIVVANVDMEAMRVDDAIERLLARGRIAR